MTDHHRTPTAAAMTGRIHNLDDAPAANTPEHWDLLAPDKQHMQGSAGRLAVLRAMAAQPAGLALIAVTTVIQSTLLERVSTTEAQKVLQALRTDGMADCEVHCGMVRWFSPAARHAAAVRCAEPSRPRMADATPGQRSAGVA